jgi:hypothetical protein
MSCQFQGIRVDVLDLSLDGWGILQGIYKWVGELSTLSSMESTRDFDAQRGDENKYAANDTNEGEEHGSLPFQVNPGLQNLTSVLFTIMLPTTGINL